MPDVVRGLAALGRHPDLASGRVYHLPVAWKDGSTLQLIERFAFRLGTGPRTLRIPRWAFRVLGLFDRDLGAVSEMIYQWEVPFVVDDARFTQEFGISATSIEESVDATIRAAGLSATAPAPVADPLARRSA